MMKKLTLILILFCSQLSFSQDVEDRYEFYSKILTERLEFGTNSKVDSIVLINQLINQDDPDIYHVIDPESDTISNFDINFLYSNTSKDSTFIRRLMTEPDLKKVITNLTIDFENHPSIDPDLIRKNSIHIQTISSDKFYSYFGKNFRRYDKGWEKIERKYGTTSVIEYSKSNFLNNFAAIYYAVRCGGLCGSGNIVVFEKVNQEWEFVTEINLWMN